MKLVLSDAAILLGYYAFIWGCCLSSYGSFNPECVGTALALSGGGTVFWFGLRATVYYL